MPSKEILDRGTHIDLNNLPPGLKSIEIPRNAKREHLASMGVKGEEAERLLELIYDRKEL